ncbi:DUF3606 domain-containing protein [Parablastomonas sp. CN1-191]|uniref:DUF3606 domain-containing protein n=1 Tax=Parablastomonas sp. CN1-191 TaxID=3400908 RepID=UPI003BF8A637
MPDSKDITSQQDRSRVAGDQDYELSYFAGKHGISLDQARDLIQQHGNDRATLDRAAAALSGGSTTG